MDPLRDKITAKEYLQLKESMRHIPCALRSVFINMVCTQLGIIQENLGRQLSDILNQFFRELDAERN